MVRIALGLEYDGSSFCGWQSQPGGCGVQDALESALRAIAGEPVRVAAAGRTDTGVHALMQVVHFDTAASRPETAWVRGVNSHLPPSVAVRWARVVDMAFHARYSAQERCYRYILLNRSVRPALDQGRAGWFHTPLDGAAMREAAGILLGEHDFSAFRAAECQAKSPVRTIRRLDIAQRGESFIIDICADAFLHHMVRNIVGCLVYVGKGKHGPEWLGRVLASHDRKLAAPTFSPDGLYLAQVRYEAHWGLPERPLANSAACPEF
ncbi:MAG: tRNA pseudouridine(38-40) synthase TruA [Burkholderiales bacterium]